MTGTVSIATRNLWRNRRRSLTTGLAVAVGAVAVLTFGGFTAAMQQGMETIIAQSEGHIHIYPQDYLDFGASRPADYYIEGPDAIITTLAADPALAEMVRVATPILRLAGLAGNFAADTSKTFIGLGLHPETYNRLGTFDPRRLGGVQPPWPLSSARPEEAVLGVGMARMLDLCAAVNITGCRPPRPTAEAVLGEVSAEIAGLGDLVAPDLVAQAVPEGARIDLLAASTSGAPNIVSLRPVEARPQVLAVLDDALVAMPLVTAQRLVHGGADRATGIIVQVHDITLLPEATARLKALLADQPLEVRTLQEFNPLFVRVLAMFGAIFGFVAVIVGVVVLFTVANTMTMSVLERVGEVGTLRAMGLRRAGVMRQFLAEGMVLGALGGLAGVVAAVLLAELINGAGLSWTPPSANHPSPIRVLLTDPALLGGIWLGMTGVATLSSLLPARRAAQMPIVDALRHV